MPCDPSAYALQLIERQRLGHAHPEARDHTRGRPPEQECLCGSPLLGSQRRATPDVGDRCDKDEEDLRLLARELLGNPIGAAVDLKRSVTADEDGFIHSAAFFH